MKLIKRSDDWGFPTLWEDLFNNDLVNFPSFVARGTTVPAVNISETEGNYTVEMAAPGMKKSDFNINLDHNVLTISSEQEENKEEKDKNFTKKEFSYQSFERSFSLPETVDQEKISAKYTEGVLKVVLPKKEEAKTPSSKVIKIS
ncbi:MAG TPA: Hsp20/alpha crystallin family protein [Bacteroidetes bacterium]|nr:Hsp20/alpha crystallin family protein [Bacteroidota bacterium]